MSFDGNLVRLENWVLPPKLRSVEFLNTLGNHWRVLGRTKIPLDLLPIRVDS